MNSSNEIVSAYSRSNMMNDPLDVVLILLNIMNSIMHGMGIMILLKIGRKKTQHIYLINLSISELLKNVIIFLTCIPEITPMSPYAFSICMKIHVYLGIVYDYTIMCSYVLTMFYITLDRYCIIVIGHQYKAFWNSTKANTLVITTWLLGGSVSVSISLIHHLLDDVEVLRYFIFTNQREGLLVSYSRPLFDLPFIILATAVYYQIFHKYSKSQEKILINSGKQNKSRVTVFTHSTFFVPVLLIGSFVAFTVIPNLLISYHQLAGKYVSHTLQVLCYISYACSDTADVFIYVLMQRNVRKFLKQRLFVLVFCCDVIQSQQKSTVLEKRHSLRNNTGFVTSQSIKRGYSATTYL